jgi:hypothetical protein
MLSGQVEAPLLQGPELPRAGQYLARVLAPHLLQWLTQQEQEVRVGACQTLAIQHPSGLHQHMPSVLVCVSRCAQCGVALLSLLLLCLSLCACHVLLCRLLLLGLLACVQYL